MENQRNINSNVNSLWTIRLHWIISCRLFFPRVQLYNAYAAWALCILVSRFWGVRCLSTKCVFFLTVRTVVTIRTTVYITKKPCLNQPRESLWSILGLGMTKNNDERKQPHELNAHAHHWLTLFLKLTIGECKESFNSFRTLLSLSKKWNLHAIVIFLQCLLKMIILLLFSQRRL